MLTPPIKIHGTKRSLSSWIAATVNDRFGPFRRWVEPFMGSGAVAFNMPGLTQALLADNNPHLIAFYRALQAGEITRDAARAYLNREGALLASEGAPHYYRVRERFDAERCPLDFLFLSRACYNGLMRFNRRGHMNVSFCKREQRFAKPYVTKICNQIHAVAERLREAGHEFRQQDFRDTIAATNEEDLLYCDPPYAGRHTTYFKGWTNADEQDLHRLLLESGRRFLLSTFYRDAESLGTARAAWTGCRISTMEHAYQIGPTTKHRPLITEALIYRMN